LVIISPESLQSRPEKAVPNLLISAHDIKPANKIIASTKTIKILKFLDPYRLVPFLLT
jgi:hypothetical protein